MSVAHSDTFIAYRRHLHQQPELSGEEENTAALIQQWLVPFSPTQIVRNIAGSGLCAIYDSGEAGPCLLFRAELDALPITEKNTFDYRSKNHEKAHLCGHDGHMSILLALAAKLHARPLSQGKVVLLFQPEEENGQGAAKMLNDERVLELQPDFVFALHNLPGYPLHQLVVRDGNFAAASEGLLFRFEGTTAHAGQPETGNSPANVLAQLMQGLPKIPEANPQKFGLITVVQVELGERNFGISPGKGSLACTVRAFEQEHFEELREEAETLAKQLADLHQLEVNISRHEGFAAVQNAHAAVEWVRKAADTLKLSVHESQQPFRWSEDFGLFTQQWSGALFGLGAGEQRASLHDPKYDFPDELIESGSSIFDQIIREVLT
ncbi:MAG: amidohydrolase [Bacteroidia bacterium]